MRHIRGWVGCIVKVFKCKHMDSTSTRVLAGLHTT